MENDIINQNMQSLSNDYPKAPPFYSYKFEGRYGRLNFINSAWALIPFILLLIGIIMAFPTLLFNQQALNLIILIIITPISVRFMALRLHDFNVSGWFALLYFVVPYAVDFLSIPVLTILIAIINFIVFIALCLIPGTAGNNHFGYPVKQGSTTGAIILIVIVSIGFLSMFIQR